ncbi:MAG: hypothetical protein GY711_03170 [bacterium]|nr:hypothetical protein [bacterium]
MCALLPPHRLALGLVWGLAPVVLALLAGCTTTSTETPVEANPREVLARGDRAFRVRAYDEALEAYKVGALQAREAGDTTTFASASAQVAIVLAIVGDHAEGRTWLDLAADAAHDGEPATWSRYLLARGMFETADGQVEAAESTYRELYGYGVANENLDSALQAAHMATSVTTGSLQLEWARRGIDIARRAEEQSWEAEQWTNLAWLLDERGLHDQALTAFRRGHELALSIGGDRRRTKYDWMLAHGLRKVGRKEHARDMLERSLDVLRRRYMQSGSKNDAEWIGRHQSELADIDASEGDVRQALRRLQTAKRFYTEAGIEVSAPGTLDALVARERELRTTKAGTGPE